MFMKNLVKILGGGVGCQNRLNKKVSCQNAMAVAFIKYVKIILIIKILIIHQIKTMKPSHYGNSN